MAPEPRKRHRQITICTPDREVVKAAAAARGETVTGLIRSALAAQGVLIRTGCTAK